MEIREFLQEHTLEKDPWVKKEELKKSFKDSADEKMKVLVELFDYGFDYNKFIKEWGADFQWDGESFNILKSLCGEYADLVRKAWIFKQNYMYQTEYFRRSFRAPNNKKIAIETKIQWLTQVYHRFNYDFDLDDYVKYSYGMYDYTNSLSFIFAVAIESGREDIYQLMLDIVYGRSDEGKIDSNIIKTLLLLDRDESRQAISQLLLSAQRQEGLRQTILEVLDEAHPNNLKYIMEIIVKNDLARFSSVVRAYDVWTGLAWEEPRKNTVKRAMDLGLKYLNDKNMLNAEEEATRRIANLEDNLEIYMALWACGVNDIEKTYPFIDKLLEGSDTQKILALYFLEQTELDFNEKIQDSLKSKNLEIAYLASKVVKIPYSDESMEVAKKEAKHLKKLLLNLFSNIGKKPKIRKRVIFSWFNLIIDQEDVMAKILNISDKFKDYGDLLEYYKFMSADQRHNFSSSFLGERRWSYYGEEERSKKPLNEKQRKFVMEALADRSSWVQDIAMKSIKRIGKLEENEVKNIETLLKRKSASLRKGCLEILSIQNDEDFFASAERLLDAKTSEERTAGLDILIRLENKNKEKSKKLNDNNKTKKITDKISKLLEEFKERKKLTIKEKALIKTLESKDDTYSLANGFGLYNPEKLKKGTKPELKEPFWSHHNISKIAYQANNIDNDSNNNINNKNNEEKWYSYSIPFDEVINELKLLDNLIEENKDVTYKSENYNGSTDIGIIGNYLRGPKYDQSYLKDRETYKEVVLFDTWDNWFKNSKLTSYDIELIACTFNQYSYYDNHSHILPWLNDLVKKHIPGNFDQDFKNEHFNYSQQLFFLIQMFNDLYPYEKRVELCLTSYENFIGSIPEDKLNEPIEREYGDDVYWQDISSFDIWTNKLTFKDKLNNEQLKKLWSLKKWRYDVSDDENSSYLPQLRTYAMAYEEGIISKEDIYFLLFVSDNLRTITSKPYPNQYTITEDYPFLKDLATPVIDRILEIELKRGDSPTTVSDLISYISKIDGMDRFFKVLIGLDKETFVRTSYYGWYSSSTTKRDNFSKIIRILEPTGDDTKEDFKKRFEESGISAQRLVEAGMYSPQWLSYVGHALGWKGMTSAAWWLHAHTNDQLDERKVSEIGRYSKMDSDEFKDGAVDVSWFNEAYETVGEEHWNTLYNAAKYISDSSGHRRAQIFADALIGNLAEDELIEKIEDKRNKDYLRALGLLKIPQNNREETILKRYKFIQKFQKESKQFGAQRQESEKLASEIATTNLGRTAGYSDVVSFKWIMEGKVSKDILKRAKTLKFDKTEISLYISPGGKIAINTLKNGRELKNIPVKLRKDPKVLELKSLVKELADQNRRTKESLEETMINSNSFTPYELGKLMKHPVVSVLLKKLVFKVENLLDNNENGYSVDNNESSYFGFYKNGLIEDFEGKQIKIDKNAKIKVAHTLDLYKNSLLSSYQQYAFENQLIQPFKQIFREIYLLTPDEEEEKAISRRYAGNQIQPKVALALLKSRSWTIDYEEGLKKLFKKNGYMAKIYALADWFSPAEVESPTIETIEFINPKNYKNVPFDKINPIDFSETMRDVDLVVSVAHAGQVDPEASHSTIEMRGSLIKETKKLLSLENIKLKDNHVMIKGTLSSYSVHLGSGVVHKQPGGYISILPVHSQHRGRIFLPFADDDPKTAEIISKILLLAEDDKIEDPKILKQIST
ncbi:MAG: DUF4132 domain-containing protein [Methanobacteriaceae archaeon]|jgi:hypothetical protein|nr:DUF4132 domain-containing protein [Candidatus Methanorudis spinitermitis]